MGSVGTFFVRSKQAGVSLTRLDQLLRGTPPETLVKAAITPLRSALPETPYIKKAAPHRLETLRTVGLTYQFQNGNKGITGVNLHLRRSTFTVITGRIGSGKTTLLRALLGLLPPQKGTVYWNEEVISARGAFLQPPRVAYTAQIPALFSESVKDNILLGLPDGGGELNRAIKAAVLEPDLEQWEDGLDTIVGPRGMKLSGGQRQRIAAARMFVRDPELFIFDDISSALDVDTEYRLWRRLFEREDLTCLVVSHRRAALDYADHIIVLENGRVRDEGTLEELFKRNEEIRRIYE